MKANAVIFVLIAACLVGCSKRFGKPVTPPAISQDAVRYTVAKFNADYSAYETAPAGEPAKAIFYRNRMVFGILSEIDFEYGAFAHNFYMGRSNGNVAGDFVQLGLAAAATVSNGETGKTILTSILTGVTGLRISIDKNFFREKTTEALVAQMDANRSQQRMLILKRLTEGLGTYPWLAARSDVIEFFYAGTIQRGLQGVHVAAALNSQKAKKDLTDFVVPPTKEELDNSAELETAVRKDFQSNQGKKVAVLLSGLGVKVPANATVDDIRSLYQSEAFKTFSDQVFREKFFAEAKKASLLP